MPTKTATALSVLVAGALLAVPLSAAAAPAVKAAPAPVTSRRAATVTLITGDHVKVDTIGGKQRVQTQRASNAPLFTSRVGKDVYVVPAAARPYLGRLLDRNLFDVTKLNAAAHADGRIPVRVAYTGSAKPSVPGVTITSASGGAASGYVTRTSASAFGKALTAQFKADAKAGFPARSTLFPNVTQVAADLPGSAAVTPKFPMFTLKLNATGVDGKPLQNAFGFLMSVDDGRKFANFVDFYEGEARVSVPAGTYSLILDDFEYNDANDTYSDRLVTVNEYEVKGAGQTLSTDFRKASNQAGQVVTPKPATVDDYTFEWDRMDAGEYSGISWSASSGSNGKLYLATAGKPKVGTLNVLQTWNATGTGGKYAYTLANSTTRIPLVLSKTFTAADLATRKSSYYTDGPKRDAGISRFTIYPWQFWIGGSYEPVAAPTTRTEYVGANGNPLWGEGYISDQSLWDDPGFWDSNHFRTLPPGSDTSVAWARGPIAPGVPIQNQPDSWGNYCWQCRTNRMLSTGLAPGLDSSADHTLEIFGAEDGIPVARFRFYEGQKLVFDGDDYIGGVFDVPAAPRTYRAVVDIDRRLSNPLQSTRSTTEYIFKSKGGDGSVLPASWFCDAGDSGCRVLPVVTAKVSLPTTLNGRLPAGKSTVTVKASRVQKAAAGTIASAGLEYRVPGYGWQSVTLKKTANGVYTGVIDNTGYDGSDVDLRVAAADTDGDSFAQTVLKAYTVAAS